MSRINCVCGSSVYPSRLSAHLTTKKHRIFMAKNWDYVENLIFLHKVETPSTVPVPVNNEPKQEECSICVEETCPEGFSKCDKCNQSICLDCQDKCSRCPFCRSKTGFLRERSLTDDFDIEAIDDDDWSE
jgi:hypothetical protein